MLSHAVISHSWPFDGVLIEIINKRMPAEMPSSEHEPFEEQFSLIATIFQRAVSFILLVVTVKSLNSPMARQNAECWKRNGLICPPECDAKKTSTLAVGLACWPAAVTGLSIREVELTAQHKLSSPLLILCLLCLATCPHSVLQLIAPHRITVCRPLFQLNMRFIMSGMAIGYRPPCTHMRHTPCRTPCDICSLAQLIKNDH